MNIRKIYLILVLLLYFSCQENNDFDILESNTKTISFESANSDRKKEFKIGKYKIDYSSKDLIKIYYTENSNFNKPNRILLYKKDKYYADYDFSKKDSLSDKSILFFSKNTSDSYRILEKISTSNLEPLPPYFDSLGKPFEYFDDSIVFKKYENLNLMYIKDNNLGKVRGAKYYYDNNYRIKKIVEELGDKQIIYK